MKKSAKVPEVNLCYVDAPTLAELRKHAHLPNGGEIQFNFGGLNSAHPEKGASANLMDTKMHLNTVLGKVSKLPLAGLGRVLVAPSTAAIWPGGLGAVRHQVHLMLPVIFPDDATRLANLRAYRGQPHLHEATPDNPYRGNGVSFCTCPVTAAGLCKCRVWTIPYIVVAHDVYLPFQWWAACLKDAHTRTGCLRVIWGGNTLAPDAATSFTYANGQMTTHISVKGTASYSHVDVHPMFQPGVYKTPDCFVQLDYEDEWPTFGRVIARLSRVSYSNAGTMMAAPIATIGNGLEFVPRTYGAFTSLAFGSYEWLPYRNRYYAFHESFLETASAALATANLDVAQLARGHTFNKFSSTVRNSKDMPNLTSNQIWALYAYCSHARVRAELDLEKQQLTYGVAMPTAITTAMRTRASTMNLFGSLSAWHKLSVIATFGQTAAPIDLVSELGTHSGWYRSWHSYALYGAIGAACYYVYNRFSSTTAGVGDKLVEQVGAQAGNILARAPLAATTFFSGAVEALRANKDVVTNVAKAAALTVLPVLVEEGCKLVGPYHETSSAFGLAEYALRVAEQPHMALSASPALAMHHIIGSFNRPTGLVLHLAWNYAVLYTPFGYSMVAYLVPLAGAIAMPSHSTFDVPVKMACLLAMVVGFRPIVSSAVRAGPGLSPLWFFPAAAVALLLYRRIVRAFHPLNQKFDTLTMSRDCVLIRSDGTTATTPYDGKPTPIAGSPVVVMPALCSARIQEREFARDPEVPIMGDRGVCTKEGPGGYLFAATPALFSMYRCACTPTFYSALEYRQGRMRSLPKNTAGHNATWVTDLADQFGFLSTFSQYEERARAAQPWTDFGHYVEHYEPAKRARMFAFRDRALTTDNTSRRYKGHPKCDEGYRDGNRGILPHAGSPKPGRVIAENELFKAQIGAPMWGLTTTFWETLHEDRHVNDSIAYLKFSGDSDHLVEVYEWLGDWADSLDGEFVVDLSIDIEQADQTWCDEALNLELARYRRMGVLPMRGSDVNTGEFNCQDVYATADHYAASRRRPFITNKDKTVRVQQVSPATPSGDTATSDGTTYKTSISVLNSIGCALVTSRNLAPAAAATKVKGTGNGDDIRCLVKLAHGQDVAAFVREVKREACERGLVITGRALLYQSKESLYERPLCSSVGYRVDWNGGHVFGQLLGRSLTGFTSIPGRVPISKVSQHMFAKVIGLPYVTPSPVMYAINARLAKLFVAAGITPRRYTSEDRREVRSRLLDRPSDSVTALTEFEMQRYGLTIEEHNSMIVWLMESWQPGCFLNHPVFEKIVTQDILNGGFRDEEEESWEF